jgi:prepilin-type N-terminal cleavage/methylation domain-containing protein
MSRRGGFTLIELMFVVVILGILSAIALPAFYKMRERAREASVKSNAHIVQLAAEDFATQNAGIYAVDDTSTLPNGDTILDLVPTLVPSGVFNPFDQSDATPIIWDGPADAEGRIGYDTSSEPGVRYQIDCQGSEGVVILTLSNGQ